MHRQITALALLVLAGCTTTPRAYNPQDSYALNVARAAGISAKLKDTELPKDTVTDITDSAGFGFAWAASGYNASIPGFSPTEIVGMSIATWLLAPEADSARNSLIVWMPGNLPKESAKDTLADMLLDATDKGVRDLGYVPVQEIADGGTDKSGVAVYVTGRNDQICQDNKFGKSNCWIAFGVRDVKPASTPSFLNEHQGETWFFDPSASIYSRFLFPKDHPGFNELELLQAASKHLPEWVYFYVAPKKVYLAKEQPIKVPLIIQQGKIHYFVKIADATD